MTDECCMLGCHGPVAETQMVPTLIDGEMVEIAYPLCQRCVDLSAQWAERRRAVS